MPVVLGDGRIRLKVSPEVSDLDFTTAVRFNGFVIPGLTTPQGHHDHRAGDGQTFAIAGLLNNSVVATKDVTPLLGDLPVLGALFRSVRYQRKETELVVLVTPRLVEPMNPGAGAHAAGRELAAPDRERTVLGPGPRRPGRRRSRRPAPAPRFHGDARLCARGSNLRGARGSPFRASPAAP